MKKILMIALVALMAVACDKDETPQKDKFFGTEGVDYTINNGVWEIETANGLLEFARVVNGDNYGEVTATGAQLDLDAKLMADIDLSGKAWIPIGWYLYENETEYFNGYTGTFDGNDKSISGLKIDTEESVLGLFGVIGTEATKGIVKKLTVNAPNVTGKDDVGALAGVVYNGEVQNCSVAGGTVTGNQWIGGLVGFSKENVIITSCGNSATVVGVHTTGGISGYAASSTITDCENSGDVTGGNRTAGVVGDGSSSTFDGCTNSGDIEGEEETAGIVGLGNGSTMKSCLNSGEIIGSKKDIGGIAGFLQNATATDCDNTAAVKGYELVGGVAGRADQNSTLTSCSNSASVEGEYNLIGGVVGFAYGDKTEVIACHNSGSVKSIAGTFYVGGVTGGSDSAPVVACYNEGAVSGDYYVGGVVGFTYSTMGSNTIAACYNTGSVAGTKTHVPVGGVVGSNHNKDEPTYVFATIKSVYWSLVSSDLGDNQRNPTAAVGYEDDDPNNQSTYMQDAVEDLTTKVDDMNSAIEAYDDTIPYRFESGTLALIKTVQ